MTVREQLVAARELIADPERWTTHYYARNARGLPTSTTSVNACRWCALGALMRCNGKVADAEDALIAVIGEADSVTTVNDEHGHAATIAMFDRAIEAAA